MSEDRADWRKLVRDVPDFPSPGILFKDIAPVLADSAALAAMTAEFVEVCRGERVDMVVAVEARGFILGAPVALALGAGFVPVRKPGKLPHLTRSVAYALEYGEAVLHMHLDALQPGDRVLIVDDVLATGGTVAATVALIREAGAEPVAAAVLLEIAALGARAVLAPLPVHVLLSV
ncbi:MAG TPA: adenine phosphoribosyltransferase [Sporichthyaceae bacterium]|nr:adenine phosphoribosyltransferase [Sporichthyaceae bacterium]